MFEFVNESHNVNLPLLRVNRLRLQLRCTLHHAVTIPFRFEYHGRVNLTYAVGAKFFARLHNAFLISLYMLRRFVADIVALFGPLLGHNHALYVAKIRKETSLFNNLGVLFNVIQCVKECLL